MLSVGPEVYVYSSAVVIAALISGLVVRARSTGST